MVIAGATVFFAVHKHRTGHSLGYAWWIVALGVLLLTLIGGKYGVWRAIIGVDGRVSTSYVITGMWTVVVAVALAYFVGRSWFYHEKHLFDGFDPGSGSTTANISDDYLILLGGPFAALVLAPGGDLDKAPKRDRAEDGGRRRHGDADTDSHQRCG
jgi:ABC-type uncharacterized transport system permease subunit